MPIIKSFNRKQTTLRYIRSFSIMTVISLNCTAVMSDEIKSVTSKGISPNSEYSASWHYQHMREFFPTRGISRGNQKPNSLKKANQNLSDLNVNLLDGNRVSVKRWLQASHTDGFLVMKKGQIIYERYFNDQKIDTQHQMFSVTKSFIGTMMLSLVEQGLVDTTKLVSDYLPELENSAYAEATVQQVMDMTNAIKFDETYTSSSGDMSQYMFAFGMGVPEKYNGPKSIHSYLANLEKEGKHGDAFHYVTPNTEVLGWIVKRVSGQSLSSLMQDAYWSKMGMENDAYFLLGQNQHRYEIAGGGLNMTLRDAGRFGQMILQNGYYNGHQILPPSVTKRILQKGDKNTFNRYYQDDWYQEIGYAYHDQWWTFNNSHKAVSAVGIHGQFIYLDPIAGVVIVKQSSDPEADSTSNSDYGPQIMDAIASYLTKQ